MTPAMKQALLKFAQSGGNNISPLIGAIGRPAPRIPPPGDSETGTSSSGPTHPIQQVVNPVYIPKGWKGSAAGVRAVRAAATQVGKPYVYGSGPDTSSFDCSDLVQWAYKQAGISIPRDTYGQMRVLPPKSWSQLRVGDPIYRKSGGHVVLYAGNGKVLAAPHTGTDVQYQPLSNFTGGDYQPYAVPSPK